MNMTVNNTSGPGGPWDPKVVRSPRGLASQEWVLLFHHVNQRPLSVKLRGKKFRARSKEHKRLKQNSLLKFNVRLPNKIADTVFADYKNLI